MSRIRSIHPGLWTDEAFVGLSPLARLFLMGIWNECDDQGSFAWSALGLKMKILPADNADAGELLNELQSAGFVMRYEVAGKPYGAVRNFCQFQRPKKPNSTYPQTDVVRNWVNLNARDLRNGSEPVGNQSPKGEEKSRQMEDGEGKKEGGNPPKPPRKKREGNKIKTPIPDDWQPKEFGEGTQSKAVVDGWPDGELAVQVEQFKANHRSKGNTFHDHQDAWSTWVLNTRKFGVGKPANAPPKFTSRSGHEYRGDLSSILRECERRGDNETYWAVHTAMNRAKETRANA